MASNIVFDPETKTVTCTIDSQPWVYSLHQEGNWTIVELRTPIRVAEPSAEILASYGPPDVNYEEFFAFFMQCGVIHGAKLTVCESGEFSGQALIEFCSTKACRKAVSLLDKEEMMGHSTNVQIASNMHRLVLKGVPQHIDKEVLVEVIRRKLGHDFEWITKSFTASIHYNNWCIKFSTSQAAADAFLAAAPFFDVEGALVEVQWAAYDMHRHVRILYYGNLNPAVTKWDFFNILDDNIDIRTMVQCVKEHCGGFITFVNKVAIDEAILKLTDLTIGNNILRVGEAPLDVNEHHADVLDLGRVRMQQLRDFTMYLDGPVPSMDPPTPMAPEMSTYTSTTTSNSAPRTSLLPPFNRSIETPEILVLPNSSRLISLSHMNGQTRGSPSRTLRSQRNLINGRVPTAPVTPGHPHRMHYSIVGEGRTTSGRFRSIRMSMQSPLGRESTIITFHNVDMNTNEAPREQPPPEFNPRNPDSA